jgi:deazaflavin-dependent oxidoreductase (nitroreductase family)
LADDPGAAAPNPSRTERIRAAVTSARELIDSKRETSRIIATAFDTFGEELRSGGPVLSAALGFRVFLFFAPFVAAYVMIFGFIADLFNKDPHALVRGSGIAALTADGIASSETLSAGARIVTLVLVLYALILSARSFLKVLHMVHTLVWDETPKPLRHTTRPALVFIGIVTAATVLSAGISALRAHVALGGIIVLGLYTFVPFAGWWFVTLWLPHDGCDRLGLIPGAIVFALGFEVLHVATLVWFPHYMQSKSNVYGALGGALALLLWAYLLGRLVTLGGALNVALWRRRPPTTLEVPAFVMKVPLVGPVVGRPWAWLLARGDADNPGIGAGLLALDDRTRRGEPVPEVNDFNQKIIEEFRTNGGKLKGGFEGAPMLLLHTRGARTGRERVNPVMYQAVGNDFAVFASKAGAPDNPAWYHNLIAHPDTSVEVGSETIPVRARVLEDAERAPIWSTQKERYPGFAEYEQKTTRTIPVVLLERAH